MPKRAFVPLQDRFVSSLAVACCPTMDLVAVLTLDHHLVVHRTISWQKLLHIKSSDVSFEMVTLAWRPDGLQLAVGCDEGDVAIFEIESGDILPVRHSSFHHKSCITAMHWAQMTEYGNSKEGSTNKRRRRKVSRASGDFLSSRDVVSQSKIQFQRRASRFLAGNCNNTSPDTLLVTADERGVIALWWMGRVLLTRIDLSKYFTEEEFRILDTMGYQQGDTECFRVEQVNFAADMSLIVVLLVFFSGSSGQVDNAKDGNEELKLHRILTLDMTAIQYIGEDVTLVASTVDCVDTLLNRIAIYGKEMCNEWKNATRIFELKMGLIGSLYEKYACEDSPQEDMLSVLVTGITPPALAQYFAQDIQEMSVHRMQKALFSGCESLRTLAEGKLKHALVEMLFLLSELCGHAKWNASNYATSLGVTISALDDLVQSTQDALVGVETLTLAIHDTHQDFALFFQWLLERIRIHTNPNRLRGGINAAAIGGRDAGDPSGSKSLLNLRRLCDFLQRAGEAAQRYRQQQPNHSVYEVETTFGNLVSLQLSARSIPSKGSRRKFGVGVLALIKCIQDQWSALLDAVAETLAQTIRREKSGCFTIGNTSNAVEECHIHFRQPFSKPRSERIAENEHQSDDEESDEQMIDWNSLKHYGRTRDDQFYCSTIMVGFRLQSGVLLLLRAFQRMTFCQLRQMSPSRLTWDAAVISFVGGSSAGDVFCRAFDFYGDESSDKQEQLAFVLDRAAGSQVHQEWLYLQPYDIVKFLPTNHTVSFEAILAQSVTHTFKLDDTRGRAVTSLSAPSQSGKSATSVVSAASRGVLCVILSPSRLAVFDAEDCEDDESVVGG